MPARSKKLNKISRNDAIILSKVVRNHAYYLKCPGKLRELLQGLENKDLITAGEHMIFNPNNPWQLSRKLVNITT